MLPSDSMSLAEIASKAHCWFDQISLSTNSIILLTVFAILSLYIVFRCYLVLIYLFCTDPYGIYSDKKLHLLRDNEEFRLIKLHPGCWNDPIRCSLEKFGLAGHQPNFEALSYAWRGEWPDKFVQGHLGRVLRYLRCSFLNRAIGRLGDPRQRVIYVNGKQMSIGVNLELALRHLREDNRSKWIWADAICINQDDVDDRNEQVKSMQDVYRAAKRVIIWLGPDREKENLHIIRRLFTPAIVREKATMIQNPREGKDSIWHSPEHSDEHSATSSTAERSRHETPKPQQVIECEQQWININNMPKHMKAQYKPDHTLECFSMIYSMAYHAFAGCRGKKRNDRSLDKRIPFLQSAAARGPVLDVLKELMHSPWWQRLWVVQETVFAKEVVVKLGRYNMDWTILVKAAENFNIHRQSRCCSADLAKLPQRYVELFTRFSDEVTGLNQWRKMWSPEAGPKNQVRLLPLLWNFRNRCTSNPRDKVYALLSLVNYWGDPEHYKQPETPRYERAIASIYKNVARTLLWNENSLGALLGNTKKSTNLASELPSWVPDWSEQPSEGERGRLERTVLYDADKSQRKYCKILGNNEFLELKGTEFDFVKTVGGLMPKDSDVSGMLESKETFKSWELLAGFPQSEGHRYVTGSLTNRQAYVRTICMDTIYDTKAQDDDNLDINKNDYRRLDDDFERTYSVFQAPASIASPTVDEIRRRATLTFPPSPPCQNDDEFSDAELLRAPKASYSTIIPGAITPSSGRSGTESDLDTLPRGKKRLRREDSPQYNFATLIDKSTDSATVSRRFFITEGGYMGLGPDDTKEGDSIAILMGSRVPLMIRNAGLRKVPTEVMIDSDDFNTPIGPQPFDAANTAQKTCYKLIGDCYVHGIMSGEALSLPTKPDGSANVPELVYLV